MNAAALVVDDGSPTITGGTLTLSGTGGSITVNTGTTTINSALAGTVGVTKNGTGTLIFGGANTFTGATLVSAGTIQSNASNTLHSGSDLTIASGTTFQFGTGSLTQSVATLSGAGNIGLNTSALTTTTNTNATLSGVISGGSGSSFTKAGSSTLTLSGSSANTYTGTTNITGGTLALNKTAGVNAIAGGTINVSSGATLSILANEQIANSSNLNLNSGSTLQLNGFKETLNALTSSGTISLGTGGHLAVGANNGNSTIGGSLTGSGTLEKLGSGSLTFNSSLSISGELLIGGGTVNLNGYNLTATTLRITADSVIDFGAGASLLDVDNLIIEGSFKLTITGWNDYVDFFFADNFSGATLYTGSPPNNIRGTGAAGRVEFNGPGSGSSTIWQGYDKQITPVPEPATYGALLMASAIGTFFCIRRRRA
ncbi:MAG: autotransporter-associated beta strand repeat-containing protein [Opitutaceae bacterium]|nr:autotransporter-associated beta strand repeat-containing protein [Opitutaceae bacterium]